MQKCGFSSFCIWKNFCDVLIFGFLVFIIMDFGFLVFGHFKFGKMDFSLDSIFWACIVKRDLHLLTEHYCRKPINQSAPNLE